MVRVTSTQTYAVLFVCVHVIRYIKTVSKKKKNVHNTAKSKKKKKFQAESLDGIRKSPLY